MDLAELGVYDLKSCTACTNQLQQNPDRFGLHTLDTRLKPRHISVLGQFKQC